MQTYQKVGAVSCATQDQPPWSVAIRKARTSLVRSGVAHPKLNAALRFAIVLRALAVRPPAGRDLQLKRRPGSGSWKGGGGQ